MPWPLDSSAAAMLASICNLLSEIIKVQSGDSGEVESWFPIFVFCFCSLFSSFFHTYFQPILNP